MDPETNGLPRAAAAGSVPHFFILAYGVGVRVESAAAGLLADLKEDFAHFAAASGHDRDIRITARLQPPDLALLKGARRLVKTGKCSVFRTAAGARAVHYPEGLVCEYDYAREAGTLSSEDPALLREIAYLLILSRLGEKLDLKGLHRIHAMAAEFEGDGFLVTAPVSGGKTTLLAELALDPAFTPLANDTPLVDSRGDIHPFPLRVALAAGSPLLARFPAGALRPFERRHYPRKYLLAAAGLSGNVPGRTRCSKLFLLKKRAGPPHIKKIGRPRAALELLISLVIGSGVPQIAEYFLRTELSDLPAKLCILLGRLGAALALLRNCGAFCFYVSPEPELNARALKLFLSRKRTASAAPAGPGTCP
ncbi:MAG: hypothetical protein A2X35_10385 [Elusimicrobia bacterium GWA2_61_42]|nr:MAG: hypothetical protein A2X35_10385 [Elusimicrobia bacterium GWA2_61_42]OGR74668.1 MAG: hypothetical protein A2X38_02350 [Elusimicrobia bacterium GWC2_61_25]